MNEIVVDIERSIELIESALDFRTQTTHAASNLLEISLADNIPPDTPMNIYAIETMSFEPGGLIQGTLLSLVNSFDLQIIGSDSIKA